MNIRKLLGVFRRFVSRRLEFSIRRPPQHCVHQPCATFAGRALCHLHRSLNGGECRNPLELDQLVQADPQQVLEIGGRTIPSPGNEPPEMGVELSTVSQHTGRDLVRQPSIVVRNSIRGIRERQVECFAGANAAENVECRLASDRSLNHLFEHAGCWR